MHILTRTKVNIYSKPKPVEHPFEVTEVTIGDLHANIIKLVYFLIRHGIIAMNDAVFDRLVQLYIIPPEQWSQTYIDELANVVKSFVVTKKQVLVRLLGDDVADRGLLDMSIFWFLAEFVKQGGLMQIHVSNHGFEFITYMELRFNNPSTKELPLNSFVLFGKHRNLFTASLANLHYILLQRWVTWEQVKYLYEVVYRPLLRVMTYSVCPNTNELHLFSHAEAGLETVSALGQFFLGTGLSTDSTEPTIKAIIDAIDKMNYEFQTQYALTNRIAINGCYDYQASLRPLSSKSAVAHLVWRRHDPSNPTCCPGRLKYGHDDNNRPNQASYREVKWFHGHDPVVQHTGHSFSLDCVSGMMTGDVSSEEEYIDLISDHVPQGMLIYEKETTPKLKQLLSNVPQRFEEDLAVVLDKLKHLIFRFVVTVTYLTDKERNLFEEEKEMLVKELVHFLEHQSNVEAILREQSILDYLDPSLEAIFLRNKLPVLTSKRTLHEDYVVVHSQEESKSFDESRCRIA